MGLARDREVVVRIPVDLGGDLFPSHYEHYVPFLSQLLHFFLEGNPVNGEVDLCPAEFPHLLLPVPAVPHIKRAAPLPGYLPDGVLHALVPLPGVYALPGTECPGHEEHVGAYPLVPEYPVPQPKNGYHKKELYELYKS